MATYANNRPSGMSSPYVGDFQFTGELTVTGNIDFVGDNSILLGASSGDLLLTVADSKAFKLKNGTGNTVVTLGDIGSGLGATLAGLWLGNITPSTTNWSLRGDALGNTIVNGSNTIVLRIGNNTNKELTIDNNGDVTADLSISADSFKLATGKYLYLNSATNTSHIRDVAGVMTLTAPAAGSFSWVVNASSVATLSSTGAMAADAFTLATTKQLNFNAGLTTHIQDESGNLVIDVATGKALGLEVNGTEYLSVNATRLLFKTGYIQAQDASVYVRSTEYGHTYLLQNTYGGTTAYAMRANPTDGAGNTAFSMKASQSGGTTALASADLLQFYAGTDGATKVALVDKDGAVQFNVSGAAKPAASSTHRGKIWVEQGGGGARDYVYACLKSDAGAYSWVAIANGGA